MTFTQYPRTTEGDLSQRKSKPSTVFTLIVGGIVVFVLWFVFYGGIAKVTDEGFRPSCLHNIKQMVLGERLYADHYDERPSNASDWMDAIVPYTKQDAIFHDTPGVDKEDYGYAFWTKASGMNITHPANPDRFELLFDSTVLQRNARSEPVSMPRPGRHDGFDNVGFLDGHAKGVRMP